MRWWRCPGWGGGFTNSINCPADRGRRHWEDLDKFWNGMDRELEHSNSQSDYAKLGLSDPGG
jgi:hypothetical protein